MTKFISRPEGTVECPACSYLMFVLKEQDRRVAIMQHPVSGVCNLSRRLYRIDRLNGQGEELGHEEPAKVQVPSHGIASAGA